MKANIHQNWYPQAQVRCACGASFTVGSTIPEIQVEVCSNCHPFYTGESKYIDTLGRVGKFQVRQSAAKVSNKEKLEKVKVAEETPRKTLQEIMAEIKTQSE